MVGSLRIERDQIRPTKSNENSHDSLLVLPELLRSIQPIYPEEARWEGSAGKVTLMFHISLYGDVTDAKVQTTSGHVDLDHAALVSISQWRFDINGLEPMQEWYFYSFRFELN